MRYTDLKYRDYFHKILAFEVDNLTDELKDVVDVDVDDCYILCSNFVDKNGELMFAVLSIGNRFDNCTKGLDIDKELKVYYGYELALFECKVVEPSLKAISKAFIITKRLENTNEELEEIRNEPSLDFIRNPFFPDSLTVKYNQNSNFNIKVTKIGDWIIEGVLEDSEMEGIVKAIPYSTNGERRLITVVADEGISKEELKVLDDFLIELSKGIHGFESNGNKKS